MFTDMFSFLKKNKKIELPIEQVSRTLVNDEMEQKSKVLFEYRRERSYGFDGGPGGSSIVVFEDGTVVRRHFIFGHKEMASENIIAIIPKIVVRIEKILKSHYDDLKVIPSCLDNGSLDGSFSYFQFGGKAIRSLNIHRSKISEVESRNPDYYRRYKDNMIYENMVLDINNEISKILIDFQIGGIDE